MKYDLLVKNGTLIDPYQQIEGAFDVAVSKGKIASIDENINPSKAEKTIDASNKIVTPGLIDLHTHVYWGGTSLGVNPDVYCLSRGSTTVVDAGTAGCRNFLGFRKFIIEKCKTRVIPFLHISSKGLIKPPELEDIRYLEYDDAVSVANKNRDIIKGFKIRFASPPNNHVGKNGPQAMRLIREAADDVGVSIMVHPKSMSVDYPLEEILKLLRKDDIVTHCFSPSYDLYFPHTEILDANGKVHKEVKDAAKRGVIFDVGHGRGSFSFETAKKAIKDDLFPTTISTDLHSNSLETAKDMPTVMSKFLALGLSTSKVIELSTSKPAETLGLQGKIGTLIQGAEADIVLFELKEEPVTFKDVRGIPIQGNLLFKPETIIKGGQEIAAEQLS